nr:5,6-dimethylbenzimidazole synthase [Fulvimarina endophytica]
MSACASEFGEEFCGDLRRLMEWRRDVRRFRIDPVDEVVLRAALDAFDLAPSVGNSQPWRLVRVESAQARRMVRESFERCNAEALAATDPARADLYARLKLSGLREAPVQLAVFCDAATDQGHGLGSRTMPEALVHSVSGAVALFALCARAHGLGVGWVSILDPDEVTAALDVPADWTLVSYLCIGYPCEADDVPELERAGWQSRKATSLLMR